MNGFTSNIDDVESAFDDLFNSFGFTSDSAGGQNLGIECVGVLADKIAEDAAMGKGADGQSFPENKEPYRTWKGKRYGITEPGYRTMQTLSLESLHGAGSISATEIDIEYGTGIPPTRSGTGQGFDPKTDGKVTDREKMGWLTEKYGDIFAANDERASAVGDVVAEAFAKHVQERFGGAGNGDL